LGGGVAATSVRDKLSGRVDGKRAHARLRQGASHITDDRAVEIFVLRGDPQGKKGYLTNYSGVGEVG
jgi:hypothetical protein